MLIEVRSGAVAVWAPAKVNLYLEVLGKRPDGYHEVATLLVAVSLFDSLEFKEESSGEVRLHCDQPGLSTGPDNLILRAAALLRARTGCRRGAWITLRKRIPIAAGLAGGSTDAAATLAGLNLLWRLRLSRRELAEWAAELGSDVPFFFATPAAWCTGRGERVTALPLGGPVILVLVCPPIGLATADVYRGVVVPEQPETGDAIRRALAAADIEAAGRRLHNRLQPAAERLYPMVAELDARLARLGPAGHVMSGSGSSLFALCRDRAEALRVAHAMSTETEEGKRPRVFIVRSCAPALGHGLDTRRERG
jgi:4-diphosphocytidyl-2-C-methyl-D-erythritol kinase